MEISEQIKKFRKENHISQRELARKIGKTGQFISLIEKGTNKPSVDTLRDIATALGVSINELLLDSVVNLSDMTKEDKENYIDLIIEYPEFKSLIKLIEKQGYKIKHEIHGSDIIITKNDDEIISKIPENDFIDFGKKTLAFINEFSEFEISKLIDIYSLLS